MCGTVLIGCGGGKLLGNEIQPNKLGLLVELKWGFGDVRGERHVNAFLESLHSNWSI